MLLSNRFHLLEVHLLVFFILFDDNFSFLRRNGHWNDFGAEFAFFPSLGGSFVGLSGISILIDTRDAFFLRRLLCT